MCRVIDNHGDLGVCLRLARQLGSRGHAVRLFVDDARALGWMCPTLPEAVVVRPWSHQHHARGDATGFADVVVEAFGCDPEPAYLHAMAAACASGHHPVWINLEYLSAEPYVQRCHGLPSPVSSGPASGMTKWFFYPGFTAGTGGLLREPDAVQPLAPAEQLDASLRWMRQQPWSPQSGERAVSLFCYAHAPVPTLARALAGQSSVVLATPGHAQDLCRAMAPALWPAGVRWQPLPWLNQTDYDHLLRACDVNLVRGEDSLVRAHWAAKPMLWQIYPQHDGAHVAKLQAWLDQCAQVDNLPARLEISQAHRVWNGLHAGPLVLGDWRATMRAMRERLVQQDDLCTQLERFVALQRAQSKR